MKTYTRHWAGITAGILSLAGYASAASVGNERYVYDASGNIIEKCIDGVVTKMSYDSGNRILSAKQGTQNDERYGHDSAGRTSSIIESNGQEARTMDYGYSDRLVRASTGEGKVDFYYNAEGKLVGKANNGNISLYAWDGISLAANDDEAYTNETHISGGVPAINGDSTVVVSDYLGNTLIAGDREFAGTAFGEGLEAGRFTGKVYVKEMNGYLFPSRVFSSIMGQWTSPDPTGCPDGSNTYSYACLNPISKLDPLGEETWDIYNRFDTPAESQTVEQPSFTYDSTTDMQVRFVLTHTKEAFEETFNIPQNSTIDVKSEFSESDSSTLSGSVTLYKAINIGAGTTATSGKILGVVYHPASDGAKVSRALISKQKRNYRMESRYKTDGSTTWSGWGESPDQYTAISGTWTFLGLFTLGPDVMPTTGSFGYTPALLGRCESSEQ
jgi:RHS repeat-associated protein